MATVRSRRVSSGFVDLAHAAGTKGREDLVRAEGRAGLEWHGYGTGTRALSSSNQFRTTVIAGVASPTSANAPLPMTRNRCPSDETS